MTKLAAHFHGGKRRERFRFSELDSFYPIFFSELDSLFGYFLSELDALASIFWLYLAVSGKLMVAVETGDLMLERKALRELDAWRERGGGRALLVDGARQIGKTYLVSDYVKNHYPKFIHIDFVEQPELARSFGQVHSAEALIQLLTLRAGVRVEPSETAVFLDEIQEVPNILTLSKYIAIDGRFPLVMSGSMLGTSMSRVHSLPVGYLDIVDMYPLDFEEFCWGLGVNRQTLDLVAEHFEERTPLEASLHEQFVQLFRLYIVIGGMPGAVQAYLDYDSDLGAVRQIQESIVRLYRDDIAKYAGNRAPQVKAIFDALPSQLNKENKRFELRTLKDNAQFLRYANDFAWLTAAHAALKTNNVTEARLPLARTEETSRFKLYASDTGLLMRRYNVEVATRALMGERSVNFGGVYENVVAQELASAGIPLRYHRSAKRGEVDFLTETARGSVVALEVKSGKDYKLHTALNSLLGDEESAVESAYVLSEAPLGLGEKCGKPVWYVPLYMLPFLTRILVGGDQSAHLEVERLARSGQSLRFPPPPIVQQ